ncbi:MAG: hypothetical protein DRP65_09205 [Planctomycetota bacterium]|nr:MAG: hypothetical protein DRP65_09205 [Planctomycetota bacterium]
MAINLGELLNTLRGERAQRYQSGFNILRGVADLFGPGYMKGAERGALASMEQSMASRGLGGTTRPGALSVGIKQGFEDIRRTRLADAMTNLGQFIGGSMPSASTLAHLATGGFSRSSDSSLANLGMSLSSQSPYARSPGSMIPFR